MMLYDARWKVWQAHTYNGVASAVLSYGPDGTKFGQIVAYNPSVGSVLNSEVEHGMRRDASSSVLYFNVENEAKRLMRVKGVEAVFLDMDLNRRLGTMGGTRITEDDIQGNLEAREFLRRLDMEPAHGSKRLALEFPDNEIGRLGSRPITSDNDVGSTEVDYKFIPRDLSPLIKVKAIKSPILFRDQMIRHNKSFTHLPVFTAMKFLQRPSFAAKPNPKPLPPVMPNAIYSDDRFFLIHAALLQLVEDASSEGRTSDECNQIIVGGLQRITRDVFLPKRAKRCYCEPMPNDAEKRLMAGIEACMKGNLSPAKRIRKEEQELDSIRGRAKHAAFQVLHGKLDIVARKEWLDKLTAIKKERTDARKRLAEAKDYAMRLHEEANLTRISSEIKKDHSVVNNAIEAQAIEQEALRGKDLHKLYQLHKRRTDGDSQEFIDDAVEPQEPTVADGVLARGIETRPAPRALSSGSYVPDYPTEKTPGSGKRLDNDITWQEVFLILYAFTEKLREHFEGCDPSCKMCSLFSSGLLQWSRIHTSRASGSDGTKPEPLIYARPPANGMPEAAYAEMLFEYRTSMSKALARALNLYRSGLPKSCGFLLSSISMIKKKTAAGTIFNPSDSSSFRGISCNNTMSNLLQSVLNVRLQHWLATEEVLTPFQFGFQQQLSTEHPQLLLREAIRMKTDEGRWVAASLVDMSNAYDDVFLKMLFDILRRAGAGEGFCSLLEYWFGNRLAAVKGGDGRVQHCSKGIPQGSPIAPTLWNILFDVLLRRLQREIPGIRIERVRRNDGVKETCIFILKCLAYADDLVITVEGSSKDEARERLQLALDVVAQWARDLSFRINTKKGKTEAMLFPPHLTWDEARLDELENVAPLTLLSLDNEVLLVHFVLEYKYLGVPLRWDLDLTAFKGSVLGKLKISIIRNLVLDPVTKRLSWTHKVELYNTLCVGQINYMLMLIDFDSNFLAALDKLSRDAIREIYGFPLKGSNIIASMESSGCPSKATIVGHQMRAYKSLPHVHRKDSPVPQLLAVQEADGRRHLYRNKMEAVLAATTATRPGRGIEPKQLRTGIFERADTVQQVKISAKTLAMTYGRTLAFDGRETANHLSSRQREKKRIKAAKRSLLLPAAPQAKAASALYCFGVGITTTDCELKRGLPRLSAVGPRVPTLLSAVSRRFLQGAWAMRLRSGRASFARPPFAPSKSSGIVLHSGNWTRFNNRAECPACPPGTAKGTDDGPGHTFGFCKDPVVTEVRDNFTAESGPVVSRFFELLFEGAKKGRYLNRDELTELKAKVDKVRSLCDSGTLKVTNTDTHNVLFRLVTLMPYPAKLADVPGLDLPLLRATGEVFDRVAAKRRFIRDAANLLARWSMKWIGKFARARRAALPADFYGKPPLAGEYDGCFDNDDDYDYELDALYNTDEEDDAESIAANEDGLYDSDEDADDGEAMAGGDWW